MIPHNLFFFLGLLAMLNRVVIVWFDCSVFVFIYYTNYTAASSVKKVHNPRASSFLFVFCLSFYYLTQVSSCKISEHKKSLEMLSDDSDSILCSQEINL